MIEFVLQHCGVILKDGRVVLTGGQEGEDKSGAALATGADTDLQKKLYKCYNKI